MREGLRIYNLLPDRAGPIRQWITQLPRIAAMGFDTVCVDSFLDPGGAGRGDAVKDYFRLNPRFRQGETPDDETLLAGFVEAAGAQRLRVMMDLAVTHAAADNPLVARHPDWFADDCEAGGSRSDRARFVYEAPQSAAICTFFEGVVEHYRRLGFAGFRCVAAHRVPVGVWRRLIAGGRKTSPGVLFCAETGGAPDAAVIGLGAAGFDYRFNGVRLDDFKKPWRFDEYEALRQVAPSIGVAESHDGGPLVTELLAAGIHENEIAPRYRQAYAFAAAHSTGVMLPMGFEYGWSQGRDVTGEAASERERFDLSPFVAEVNALKRTVAVLNEEGPQRLLSGPDDDIVALLRRCENGANAALVLVNTSSRERRVVALDSLLPPDLPPLAMTERFPRRRDVSDERLELDPLTVCVIEGRVTAKAAVSVMSASWRHDQRIRIEDVYPELGDGRFPVKRIVGETFELWADLVCDGHDRLAAVIRYRPPQGDWCETPFVLFDNDRWVGRFQLDRVGLWQYTVEAWIDRFDSWRDEFTKKREAGQTGELELVEGRALVAAAVARAAAEDAALLDRALNDFDGGDRESRAALMLSATLAEVMARASPRDDPTRYGRTLEIVVDRERARFAAWYEMFPRSQGTQPGKGASFDDCIARLPQIASLGFDVVYLPPIHPIGRVNRKGKNNANTAQPGDPGSPYAIGSIEGGHRAVNPELGTLDDFRRFVRAASGFGLDVALDFAIQCAPDHPWIREHPQWFRFRPDGTIRYAENPPKKYEDIVNVDFANPDWRSLWLELRDTLLFWVDEGVTTFRVDNPHTKPLPFWEWLIGEVKARCPEAIFLSEAFTRPKMMRALAKVGFSQSYTYFTWRNNKVELIEYLTELSQGEVKEYLRPNFFTNTPDILPFFLQEGGRPAFRIRLVLAGSLSPAYGIYNGFELCENTPLPGREEYLDSEKYEYKVWDWDRPGNIKDDVATLNRFRRDNPAMRELANLRFLECADPNILAYAKWSADRANLVVAAVNLDPHAVHEADIELPIAEFDLDPDAEFVLDEAFSGRVAACRGSRQSVRLDPQTNPAELFRLLPARTS
jgi:starch synthase (maltosyl-transferring)